MLVCLIKFHLEISICLEIVEFKYKTIMMLKAVVVFLGVGIHLSASCHPSEVFTKSQSQESVNEPEKVLERELFMEIDLEFTSSLFDKGQHDQICREKFVTMHLSPSVPRKDHCQNLRPGLKEMTKTVNLYSFGNTNFEPSGTPIMNFTCKFLNREDAEGYLFPSEIKDVQELHEPFEAEVQVGDNQLMRSRILFGYEELQYMMQNFGLFVVNSFYNSPTSRIVLLLKMETYTARVASPLTLSSSFISEYKSMGVPYKEHQVDYFNFIKRYGTHLIQKGIFGGKVVLTATWDSTSVEINREFSISNQTIPALLFSSMSSNSHIDYRYVSVGGRFHVHHPLSEWINSVRLQPSLIKVTPYPLSDILKAYGDTKKHEAFTEAIRNEEMHQKLKKYAAILNKTVMNLQARKYLQLVFGEEIKLISPRSSVVELASLIASSINSTQQMHLLITRHLEVGMRTNSSRKISIPVFPNICTSWGYVFQNMESVQLQLPNGLSCLKFFEEKLCKGNFKVSRHGKQIIAGIAGSFSIEMC